MRLNQERKSWRMDHPSGFVARPETNDKGVVNLMRWRCEIPGPKDSVWERGVFKLFMEFPRDYPLKPPRCYFKPVLPHPNIYPSGTVCLSILNEEEDWKPSLTIKNILLGIQKMLKEEPNLISPAQLEATKLYKKDKEKYQKNAREFSLLHSK